MTIKQILVERGSRYGNYQDLSHIDQSLKHCLHKSPNWISLDPHHQTALEMIVHKIARILNGDPSYEDNWDDISGYSQLGKNPDQ